MAGPKPMLTEFGICQRLESCAWSIMKGSWVHSEEDLPSVEIGFLVQALPMKRFETYFHCWLLMAAGRSPYLDPYQEISTNTKDPKAKLIIRHSVCLAVNFTDLIFMLSFKSLK